MSMLIDAAPTNVTVNFGVEKEDQVRECLNKFYGYNLVDSTFSEDTVDKTDCWEVMEDDTRHRCAIKVRTSKNDILFVMREPFYGVYHEGTRIGRDVKEEYKRYITLSADGTTIRDADGHKLHEIYISLWDQLIEDFGDIDLSKHPYNRNKPCKLVESREYPGCEVWLHFDRRNGRPKLLGFCPPSLLTAEEISYYPLKS